jgi:DNA helicase-2/ATP-dependent DNA helicase PcrA
MTDPNDPILAGLNPPQREAALAADGPVLILAGAGSGKTTVLIRRIAWLIQRRNTPPWSILAITFTNKAARELKERLESFLGGEGLDVWACTFHASCTRILRRNAERIGFPNSFTIYDTADSERAIKDILKAQNLPDEQFPPRSILHAMGRAKDTGQSPEALAAASGGDFRLHRIAAVYAAYQKKLLEAGAMDFDDLLYFTVRLLEECPDVLDYYQNRFRYVLIDEYQDTNQMQYRLASLLSGKRRNLCVVGDDDQSIYRFRGATLENILGFEAEYPDAKVIRLEQNYRSTGHILAAASGVISRNKGRKGKTLWTDQDAGAKLTVHLSPTESDEAAYIAHTIIEGRTRGQNWRDFAVLYRTNAQSNRIEDAFKRNGVPYRVFGGLRFFDRQEVKDMLAYLCVVLNPSDTLRLARIVNNPARGISPKTWEVVLQLAGRHGQTPFEIMRCAGSYPDLAKQAAALLSFTAIIEALRVRAENEPLVDFYDAVVHQTGYIAALEKKDNDESRQRIENVRELGSSVANYAENADEPTLAGFLEETALFTDIERYDGDADAAVMMTMHSAKGLEFPSVFVVGMEEGLFPGMRSIGEPEEIEEERRLCYVALTRARKHLTLTHADTRMLYGKTNRFPGSRFLNELPEGCFERKGLTFVGRGDAGEKHPPPVGGTLFTERGHGRYAPKPRPSFEKEGGLARPGDFPALQKGETVHHKAFGKGLVVDVKPMGGDALLEIAFDGVGTKRLMAKAAAGYLVKQ